MAVQAERAGDAAPLARAAEGSAGPAVADPHPVPAGPGSGPAPEPGREDPRGRPAEDLGGDLRPVRRQRAAVPGRPGRRGKKPCGAGRSRGPAAEGHRQQLAAALTGRFREVHAFEIATHLRLIDTINEEITRLDARIEQQLASIPGVAPACAGCGLIGGGHSPGCFSDGTPVPGLVARLGEITGVGVCNARVLIAELGTDMSVFPTPGHAAAWARLTSRTLQSGNSARPGRTGKGNPYLRGALGQCVMAAARTDTRLGEQYRRIARRRGKQKAIVAVSRVICEIACILISDPGARFTDLGADYYNRGDSRRQTRSRIRELERLNPGMKVTLTPVQQAA